LGLISQELLVWADPDNRINYMIKFLSILLLTAAFPLHAQKKFVVVIGKIDFTSDALLELISASSEKARGIIDPNTRQFAFVVSTRSFKGFNSDLQREHFNEKYMESEKYPESTFVGTLTGSVNFKVDGVYQVYARGTLSVHGKKQPRTISGTITVANGKLTVDSYFIVPLADHDITIPKIVNQKIATEIRVTVKFLMEENDKQ
jgi:hypothetical protein